MVKVKQGPFGTEWEVEDLGSGATASFPTPQEMVEFIRAHTERKGSAPGVREAGAR